MEGKAAGNRQQAAGPESGQSPGREHGLSGIAPRRPTPHEIIDACCKATGGSAALYNLIFTRCPFHGTLFVSVYASAARRAAAVLMRERGIGLAEISEHLGYASRCGPNWLLRREPTNFERRVERDARAALGMGPGEAAA